MMSSEQRLDRLERMLLLVVKAGARERKAIRERVGETREGLKETDEKINALIDAQMRNEESFAQFKHRTEEAMAYLAQAQAHTEEKLSAFIANTDEKLNAFIGGVERLVNERREGKP
jgi:predicted  nucleic acid-binding Zn-ribbon protein